MTSSQRIGAVCLVAVVLAATSCAAPGQLPTARESASAPATVAAAQPVPGPGEAMEAGTYSYDLANVGVTFRLPTAGWDWFGRGVLSGGWEAWDPGATTPGVSLGFVTVVGFYADPCRHGGPQDWMVPNVGSTVEDLAQAFAQMPGHHASQPLQTTVDGYPATYLRVTIDPGLDTTACDEGAIASGWVDPEHNGLQILGPAEISDYWIVDAHGVRLLIFESTFEGSTSAELAMLKEVFDSIRVD